MNDDPAAASTPRALLPFVPAGPDFATACAFFETLGFERHWENDGYAGFTLGAARFILQALDNAEFAGNLMIKIEVDDVDAWWGSIAAAEIEARFPGARFRPPTDFPWGREVHFVDPAGVCWHVGRP